MNVVDLNFKNRFTPRKEISSKSENDKFLFLDVFLLNLVGVKNELISFRFSLYNSKRICVLNAGEFQVSLPAGI